MNIIEKILKGKDDNFAVITKTRTLTYSGIKKEIDKASSNMLSLNINEKEITGIISENSEEFIIHCLALWNIGAVPVPLNVRLSSLEVEEQIKFLECKYVLRSHTVKTHAAISEVVYFPFDKVKRINIPKRKSSNNDTALILFTSGSSGKPKGVVHTFGNLIGSSLLQSKFLKQKENDNWLAALPFYHIGGFMTIMRAFLSGAAVIIPESLNAISIKQCMFELNPAFISLVSTQLKRLLDEGVYANPGQKTALLGGGYIDEQLIRSALDKKWKIMKVYGSTETCSFITALDTTMNKKIPSAGKPLPKIILRLDENKTICVEYPFLFKGYYKNAEQTQKSLINNIFNTGDTGSLDDDGYLFVNARQNNLVISGGENIDPSEIERIILTYKGVKDIFLTGIENKEWGLILTAFIVNEKEFQLSGLINYLKERAAGYKIPKKWFTVKEIPRNELGKIEKKAIDELIKLANDEGSVS